MELYVGVIGIIAGVFVVIFGGRGLVDLVRGYSERRRGRLAAADGSPGAGEPGGVAAATTIAEKPPESAGPTPAVPIVEPDPVYRRTFVGRDAELKQLHDAFDEAMAGHGSLAMVVGEPGIGKTSLCEQLAAHVLEKGGKTLVGHCYEEGSLSLPYLAFVEAVRSHVLVLEPEDLKAQLGQGADELARVVPEIRERMQVELAPIGDPEEERYRLLQAASDFLRNAAAAQPLLVVLEDLHDADRGTLEMLTHLARNLSGSRLLVIGTYRDVQVSRTHPLAGALAELRRVTSFERIPLRGLSQDEVHRMLQTIAGHEVPWRWAEVVHRQTEGNPLFIQEVMRYLVEEGLLAREEGELRRVGDEALAGRIPEGLRDVIGKRMARLSEQANQVLSVAAVIGRDFSLDVLQRVLGRSEEELFEAIREALATVVVEERMTVGALVSYRFTHAFFRQTLYEEMIAPERIRLHQQVARALEETYADEVEAHASELAEHSSYSSDPADLSKAVEYGEMAARQAVGMYAYGEAVRLLEQALRVQQVLGPGDKARRCDLLLALGEAMLPGGEPMAAAEKIAPEALELATALEDNHRASQACLIALRGLRRYGSAAAEATTKYLEWVERADRHTAPGTPERVEVDSSLANAGLAAGHWREAVALRRKALAAARQLGDPETLFSAAWPLFHPVWLPQQRDERLALAEEFTTLPRTGVSAATLGRVLFMGGVAFMHDGDRERAEQVWRQLADLGARTRDPEALMRPLHAEGLLMFLDGRLEEAVETGARIRALGEDLGAPVTAQAFAAQVASIPLSHLGRVDREMLSGSDAMRGAQNSLALARSGEREPALAALDEFRPRFRVPPGESELATNALNALLDVSVLVRDTEAARHLMPHLASLSRMVVPEAGSQLGCAARHLGAAAAMLDKLDDARAYYADAIEVCERVRFRPELALTRLQLAELLLDHYPDERDEAIEHLDFAIAEFREMKMAPSLERAEALKAPN
ncbi:MAG: AAA family ATPase [Proteobacteria bacterium]|nr:AAA family ATPase [Pseudomonadota bacterium]